MLGKLNVPQANELKLDHYFTPCTKINSKQLEGLNILEIIKLLDKIKGEKILKIGLGRFYGYHTRSTSNKSRNKCSNIKLKCFSIKEAVNKM